MSNSDLALSVRGLSKSYTIAHGKEKHTTLAEAIVSRIKQPMKRAKTETFWALQDVSFDVNRGEVVGIIGRNGAGKSTLLKILSRITGPTDGTIDVFGRIGSLLEVGTGFHQELTGRENVFLNGAILGMRRAEIAKQFDAIVDFAGVEQFIDTPVKRYSSGMYVRLAFAVAAHLASDILIIDEVLAVGDMEFQKKCLGKMKDVASGGRTVLFVSHQMQTVAALCTKGIYLENGTVGYNGTPEQAITRYLSYRQDPNATKKGSVRRGGSGELRFSTFGVNKDVFFSVDPIEIEMEVTGHREGQPAYFISLEIFNQLGIPVLHLDSRLMNKEFTYSPRRVVRFNIRDARLAQGEYTIHAYICGPRGVIDQSEGAGGFTIAPLLPYPSSRGDCARNAIVYPPFTVEDVTESLEPAVMATPARPSTTVWS